MARTHKQMPRYQREAIGQYMAKLPADAALRTIVQGPEFQGKLAAFEAADDTAVYHQNRYRRSGRLALWATTIGTLVGALLLLPLDRWIVGLPRGVVGLLQTLALIATFLAIQWMGWRKPVDIWMTSRAEAEGLRGEIFRTALEAPQAIGAAATSLANDKLGFLLEPHVVNQLDYYDRASRKHAKAIGRLRPMRLVGYLLTSLSVALGALAALQVAMSIGIPISAWLRQVTDWLVTADASRWQLGLGTMASSLLAHASARSLMDQDERNAALYARTAAKVRKLLEDNLAGVRAEVATGREAALRAFFVDVRRILEEDQAAWFLSRAPSDPLQVPDHRVVPVTA